MNEELLLNRRRWLIKSGKAAAAMAGLAVLGGAGSEKLISALATARAANLGFDDKDEKAAWEELTYESPQETCTLTGAQTLGPCYAANAALVRRDIKAGATGLPMRLGFRLVRASDCQPISGATVDVWHTHALGIYSALTAQVCTTGANVVNETWCRGVQTTDSNGFVYFDSIFPGWYSSRTVHIHFTVRVNGNISVTSQFAFPERVNEFIFRKHPLYNTRGGTRSTFNTNDTVFTTSNISSYMFNTRYKNNQLHAYKTLIIA